MRCTSPRTVGFQADGKTLAWSYKNSSKEFPTFQLPCGKCIACRLSKAREKAIRCVHESQMYENNSFITLTYSDEHLKSNKLKYSDFQNFIKKLRNHIFDQELERIFPDGTREEKRLRFKKEIQEQTRKTILEKIRIGVFVTGEYGPRGGRPHWHAIIFNWTPGDREYYRSNEHGDRIYKSSTLDRLWGFNDASVKPSEIGDVTLKSAEYVARYAQKKLVHGLDGTHEFEPISKNSSKNAIGKKWLEKYWRDVFTYGYVVLPDGTKMGVPRYYEEWLKKHHIEEWEKYRTSVKTKIIKEASERDQKITLEERKINMKRFGLKGLQISRNKVRNKILKKRTKETNEKLKL